MDYIELVYVCCGKENTPCYKKSGFSQGIS